MLGFAVDRNSLMFVCIVSAYFLFKTKGFKWATTMHMGCMTMALPMIALFIWISEDSLTKGLVRIKSYFGKCLSILGLLLVCWFTLIMKNSENIINMGQKPVNDAKKGS